MSNTTPLGWEVSSLDQVFSEIKNGCSIDQNTSGDGIPVTRIETISQEKIDYSKVGWVKTTDDIDRFKIEKYDILLSHINSLKHIGKTAIKEDDRRLYHGMNLLRLKGGKAKFYPVYIHNLLSWEVVREEMRRKAKQAINQASLNVQDIKSLTYVLPPLPEQQKIATILSSVDDVIEKTRAQIDKLKDLKTGMMQELLTKGIGHTEFKDSPVGRIPAAWDVVELGSVVKLERGRFSHRPRNDPQFYGGNIPFLQTGDIPKEAPQITVFSQTLNEKGLSVSKLFPRGTLVLTIAATIGEIGILEFDSCFPDSLVGLKVNQAKVKPMFILYLMRHFKTELKSLAPQTAQKNINLDILQPFPIPLPSIGEQELIANSMGSVDDRVNVLLEKLERIKNTKKALMQDLLTGKVRVKPNKSAAL